MNRDKLLLFYEVATLGSIKKAADKMASNSPTVSRIISTLEEEIGYDLFTSAPKRMTLTREGEILLYHAKHLLLGYEDFFRDLRSTFDEMGGEFNISTNTGSIALDIFEALKDFIKCHQNISLSFTELDTLPDFALRETDIDIRPLRKNEKEIECHYLKTDLIGLYASEDYLIKYGSIDTLNDFKKHNIFVFPHILANNDNQNLNWHLPSIPSWNKKIVFQSNLIMKRAIESGMGIGPLSQKEANNSSIRLIPILPEKFTNPTELYFMYPKVLFKSKAVSEIYKHLKNSFQLEEK